MPQLNPAPWFMTLIIILTTIMLLFKPALLRLHPMTPPIPRTLLLDSNSWTWPWY